MARPIGRRVRGVRAVRRRRAHSPSVAVVGDLMLDVVVIPSRPLERGTDVPGTVALRQGGSAANTARWLARLGARSTLVTAVGRDPAGRALVEAIRADGATVRPIRVAGKPTGRIGVVVMFGGERSFVADRGAADELRPDDLKPGWFAVDLVHLPAYSLHRLAAGRRRPPGDRAGAGGRCARQPRSRVGGAAAREGPPGGASPRRRRGAGPPLLDRGRGRGVPRRL